MSAVTAIRRMKASWARILRETQGMSSIVWTRGQDGILALCDALLHEHDGDSARMEFSSWAPEGADVQRLAAWCDSTRLESAAWHVDQSFESRGPEFARVLRSRFGPDCIRPGKLHWKGITLSGTDWKVGALTSASLDAARRLEWTAISEDPRFVQAIQDSLDAGSTCAPMPDSADTDLGQLFVTDPGTDSIHVLEGLIDSGNPQPLTIGVWTVSTVMIDRVRALLDSGLVSSVRWLVDGSMSRSRSNAGSVIDRLRDRFGDDAIRCCSIHGKFWRLGSVTCLTSANLNRNPRAESFLISHDPEVAAQVDAITGIVWDRQKSGEYGRSALKVNRVIEGRGSGPYMARLL